jgi:hypothetical protein
LETSKWAGESFSSHKISQQLNIFQAKVYILKQCWQRLPGLGSEPQTAQVQNNDSDTPDQVDRNSLVDQFKDIDRKPFEAFVMERAGWKERIKASWNVELDGEPISTFKTIRKNHATSKPPEPDSRNVSSRGTSGTRSGGSLKGPIQTIDYAPDHPALVTRTLVRLVFDRPGWPIERFTSKLELLYSLKMIVEGSVLLRFLSGHLLNFFLIELETLHKNGVVHRDVSPSNLIISDSGGHIIDYDHSKVGFVKGEVAVKATQTKDVVEIATNILDDAWQARIYVNHLKELWIVNGRDPTSEDFGWPEVGNHSNHSLFLGSVIRVNKA